MISSTSTPPISNGRSASIPSRASRKISSRSSPTTSCRAFRHVWPDSWGPRLDYILTQRGTRAARRARRDTAHASPPSHRRAIPRAARRSPRSRSGRALILGQSSMPDTTTTSAREAIAPIQNKIGKALMVPSLRNMLAQPKSTITLRRLMDEGAIVICNLSKGSARRKHRAPARRAHHLAIAQAALSRTDTPVGEAARVPPLCRRISIIRHREFCAHSLRGPQVRTDAHDRAPIPRPAPRSICAARCSAMPDRSSPAAPAPRTPRSFRRQIGLGGPDALLDLPNFAAWARLLRDGVPTSPLRIDLHDAPPPRRSDPHRLIATSRIRFGRPRAEVEARISKFLAG